MTPQLSLWLLPLLLTLIGIIGMRYLDSILKRHRDEVTVLFKKIDSLNDSIGKLKDELHSMQLKLTEHISATK